jgi:hypothetical protein
VYRFGVRLRAELFFIYVETEGWFGGSVQCRSAEALVAGDNRGHHNYNII